MNKTFLCIYINSLDMENENKVRLKKYSFNTEDKISVGDVFESNSYNNMIEVVKILDISYKYFNIATGELSNDFNSSNQYDIRNFKISKELKPKTIDTIFGKLVFSKPKNEIDSNLKITL